MQTQSMKLLPFKVIGLSVLFICGILLLSFTALATYVHYEHGSTSLDLLRPQSLILSNVNVLSMEDNSVKENHTVIVREGVITAVQPANAPLPQGLTEVDGQGGFVMPGLIDLHVHVLDRSYAKSALAAGVTTLRNMGGYDYQLKWREELNRGEWFGSRLILSSPIFNSVEQGDPLSHFRVNDPQIARQAVRDYINQGYDFIKVYEGLHADVYQAVLDEAKHLGVSVAGHPSYELMAENLQAHGALASFEHVEEVFDGFLGQQQNPQKVQEAADFLREQQVPLIPTLAVNQELTLLSQQKQTYLNRQDLAAINPFVRLVYEETSFKRWLGAAPALADYNQQVDDYLNAITLTLYEQGVTLGLGSDAGALVDVPGPATVREALLMVKAGIPAYEVLKSATVNAAAVIKQDKALGKIAPGFKADMLLLADNPLTFPQTLARPQMVIQGGKTFNEHDLRMLRAEGHQHSGGLVSATRHLLYLIFA
ncbi:amidohydrolase family protein [Alteromonas lipolytica]|nr:amidohydrolase family protein [Alteromonas lipolytica]GGF54311.1 amidohydrolase [Alteromonas lipolytica]